jgi:GTP:adenosylcobinamide-phosphate guanylyltransferase
MNRLTGIGDAAILEDLRKLYEELEKGILIDYDANVTQFTCAGMIREIIERYEGGTEEVVEGVHVREERRDKREEDGDGYVGISMVDTLRD